MKAFSSIIILIVASSLTLAIDPAEKKAQMMQIFTACKASTNANDDDIAKLMLHSKPTTQEGKCMFSCIMEKMGIVSIEMLSFVDKNLVCGFVECEIWP